MEYISPGGKKDFSVDLVSWLPSGDTTSVIVWTLESGLTLDSQSKTDSSATLWAVAASDIAGKVCRVRCDLTSTQGREQSFDWFLMVQRQHI